MVMKQKRLKDTKYLLAEPSAGSRIIEGDEVLGEVVYLGSLVASNNN